MRQSARTDYTTRISFLVACGSRGRPVAWRHLKVKLRRYDHMVEPSLGHKSGSAGNAGSDTLNSCKSTPLSKIRKEFRLNALVLLLAFAAAASGCSIKRIAVNKLGDSLASGGTTFASDDDPDLVGDALPFSLKLMESPLAESPQHRGLLFAASSGFTQYAFVYVQVPAEEIEGQDLAKYDFLRARARKLYVRARNFGLRGLEVNHRGFESKLRQNAP